MAGDPPGLELVLSLPREVKLPRAEVLPRAVSIPELSSCVARRSTSTIGPTESRSTAATCVFESPVWPLIESTRSFTCMPLREAMPRGSSAATMGCTTSSLVKKSRSKPSSYRTNRMPSLVSRSTLWSTTSRSARDGAGASSESLRRGVSTRRALEKSDAVGLLARSRRKVCLAAGCERKAERGRKDMKPTCLGEGGERVAALRLDCRVCANTLDGGSRREYDSALRPDAHPNDFLEATSVKRLAVDADHPVANLHPWLHGSLVRTLRVGRAA
eukprot:scaffold11731_cov119-Isochrysis_galbana.AAC.4